MANITTVINYCTNEYRFISASIKHALSVSNHVIVPVCDHFFSGQPERRNILNKTYEENPHAHFIEIPFSPELRKKHGPHFWHNAARWIAIQHLPENTDFVLFLDADEIVDDGTFNTWLQNTNLEKLDAVKFLNYWYFRDLCYQATELEDSVVMTRASKLTPKIVFTDSERHALEVGHSLKGTTPLIHHYSWVRTKAEMLTKVKNWGHTDDRKNWVALVEEEFSHPFTGKDFVHNYTFNTIDPFITLSLGLDQEIEDKKDAKRDFDNVTVLSESERDFFLNKRTLIGRIKNRLKR